ncbi:MAG: BatD family protein [Candidatus Omnitrophica bacterium]|nr:BatD family protein [Candidatus Omnitrophota bacterium]
MRKTIAGVVFLCAFVCAVPALAETAITSEVDKQTISAQELLTYKVVVVSSEKNIPQPVIPAFEGFVVVSQAQSTTSSFQRGAVKTILVYAFILLPRETGTLKIKPAQIRVNGTAYASKALEITVTGQIPRPEIPWEQEQPEVPDSGQPKYTL